MERDLAKVIGLEARRARTALDLTQQDAAERLGLSLEFYARIERGGTLPSVPTLFRLANSLETTADALLGSAPEPAPTRAPEPRDDRQRLLRRIVRRLEQANETTLKLVNQVLVAVEQLHDEWASSNRHRRKR